MSAPSRSAISVHRVGIHCGRRIEPHGVRSPGHRLLGGFGLRDQDAGARVLEAQPHLRRLQQRVERDRDRAEAQCRVVAGDKGWLVGEEQADAVSQTDGVRAQNAGEARRALLELRVVGAHVVVEQRGPRRMACGSLREKRGEVVAHPLEGFTRAGTSRALV